MTARENLLKMLAMPDAVRRTLIGSMFIMHAILVVLGIAPVVATYDDKTLDTMESMFSGLLAGIAAAGLLLVGDRGVKNVTTPAPEIPATTTLITTEGTTK